MWNSFDSFKFAEIERKDEKRFKVISNEGQKFSFRGKLPLLNSSQYVNSVNTIFFLVILMDLLGKDIWLLTCAWCKKTCLIGKVALDLMPRVRRVTHTLSVSAHERSIASL